MEMDALIIRLLLDKSGFDANLKDVDKTATKTGDSLKTVMSGIGLGGVVAFASITGAITGTIAALKACVDTSQEYLQTIEHISLLNGTNADETARLISVMGRYGITTQQIDLASRTMAKEGLSLTTKVLQDMSNQFNALSSADEKEAFLMKNFGARGGTAFVQMMNAGSGAIGDLAASTDQALIPTGEMMQMTEDMEGSTHALSDAWKGFQLQIGTEIIPSLIELMKALVPVVDSLFKIAQILQFIYNMTSSTALAGGLVDAFKNDQGTAALKKWLAGGSNDTSGRIEGFASGTMGWQTVPAGYPNDSYNIGMSSGETFAVNGGSNNNGMDYRKLARAIRDALNG